MSFRVVSRVLCAALLVAALAVPKPASAYFIITGTGSQKGGGGSNLSFIGGSISIMVMTMLALYYQRLGASAFAYAGDDDISEQDVFRAMPFAGSDARADAGPRVFNKALRYAASPWGGFYIGGHAGTAFSNHTWRDTFGDLAGVPGDKLTVTDSGFLGGVHAGYEWRSGVFAYGVEGEFSGASAKDHFYAVLPPAIGTFEAQTKWLASVDARVGILTVDPFFKKSAQAYLKGGVSFAQFSYNFVLNGAAGPFIFGSQDDTKVGWNVGIGYETAISKNWAIRSEAIYHSFAKDRVAFAHPVFGPARFDIDQQIFVTKTGLTYRFNPGR